MLEPYAALSDQMIARMQTIFGDERVVAIRAGPTSFTTAQLNLRVKSKQANILGS